MKGTIHSGHKLIKAHPMTRQEYNAYRGWQVPADEDPSDTGFLVEYLDGGMPNVTGHSGYVSWSPTDVFERAYRPSGQWTFSDALEALKSGQRVARSGWNGKGMFLFLVRGSRFTVNREPLLSIMGEGTEVTYQPHIDMVTVPETVVPWLASQSDMLASDWEVVI